MRAAYNTVVVTATVLSVYGVLVWAPWPSSAMLGTLVLTMGALSWSHKPHPRRVARLLMDWEQAELSPNTDHREPALWVTRESPGGLGDERGAP